MEKRYMAATPDIGDIWRVIAVCESPVQNGLNISHWATTFNSSTMTPGAFFDDMDNTLRTLYANWLPDRCRYIGLIYQRIWPTPVLDRANTSHAPVTGTVEEDMLPSQCCGAISLRTGLAGRKFRGRKYIPFPARTMDVGAGTPTVAALALLAPLGTHYSTPWTVVGGGGVMTMAPVLWHPTDHTYSILSSFTLPNEFTTQRRRGLASKADALIPAFA
jgi:hypothetical protein